MGQLYLKDSGLLILEGLNEAQYQSMNLWDPAVWGTSDTGQEFTPFSYDPETGQASGRVPNCEVWFYVPFDDLFYESKRGEHAILAAAKQAFNPSRWEEIKDALDEHANVAELLNRLDIKSLKRKAQRAVAAGKISVAEMQRLKDVVNHLP